MDENGTQITMPVQPMGYGAGYGGGYGYPVMPVYGGFGGGFGNGFGGDIGWLVLIILLAGIGGWGGMGGFGGFGGGLGFDFPWLLNGQNQITASTADGFRSAEISSQLSAIQNTLASGEIANCGRAMDAMQTAYTNQIADLNRSFDSQTAITAGQNAIQSQLAKCLKKISEKAKEIFGFTNFEAVGTCAA